jgi:dihydroorotate dehydrogenase electron transfer subunit
MLRRPFSIAALRRSAHGCEIDLLGRITGEGTAWLASRDTGDAVDVLGPLGRGFSLPPPGSRVLLVAGGIGLPPVRWLGEELRKNNIACEAVYGAITRDLLPVTLLCEPPNSGELRACVEEFARYGINTLLTTDDGSCGMRGQVTDGMRRYCETIGDPRSIRVYACGSEAMLRAIARFCAERSMPCEMAMERKMGCGMGTCQSCVVPVTDKKSESGWRYALCCTDGPVFDAADVLWSRVAG